METQIFFGRGKNMGNKNFWGGGYVAHKCVSVFFGCPQLTCGIKIFCGGLFVGNLQKEFSEDFYFRF